jgi:hypothetical protein
MARGNNKSQSSARSEISPSGEILETKQDIYTKKMLFKAKTATASNPYRKIYQGGREKEVEGLSIDETGKYIAKEANKFVKSKMLAGDFEDVRNIKIEPKVIDIGSSKIIRFTAKMEVSKENEYSFKSRDTIQKRLKVFVGQFISSQVDNESEKQNFEFDTNINFLDFEGKGFKSPLYSFSKSTLHQKEDDEEQEKLNLLRSLK